MIQPRRLACAIRDCKTNALVKLSALALSLLSAYSSSAAAETLTAVQRPCPVIPAASVGNTRASLLLGIVTPAAERAENASTISGRPIALAPPPVATLAATAVGTNSSELLAAPPVATVVATPVIAVPPSPVSVSLPAPTSAVAASPIVGKPTLVVPVCSN
jgi:hypothetical protein